MNNNEEMTLLDMFAASAMNGILARDSLDLTLKPAVIAELSYIQAHEMIRQRLNYIGIGENNASQ